MESVEHGVISAFAWITGDEHNYLKNNINKNFEELDIDSLDIVEVCGIKRISLLFLYHITRQNIPKRKRIKDKTTKSNIFNSPFL